jgi:hypothetical protein
LFDATGDLGDLRFAMRAGVTGVRHQLCWVFLYDLNIRTPSY